MKLRLQKQVTLLLGMVLFSSAVFSTASANDLIVVRAGNTIPEMPDIPASTKVRHASGLANPIYWGNSFSFFKDRLNNNVFKGFIRIEKKGFPLRQTIRTVGELYGVDPAHVLAALVGEHVFNVDVMDSYQEYILRSKRWKEHFSGVHPFARITKCEEMLPCQQFETQYDVWSCYETTWHRKFRGRVACGGEQFGNGGMISEFFNPTLAGKTYGLGQMGPVKILSLTDYVSRVSGFRQVDINHVEDVYSATLDPEISLHYVAASIRMSMDSYANIAGFDISNNLGITATLYNVGEDKDRAEKLRSLNQRNKKAGRPLVVPAVNYYGWFVNAVESDIRGFLNAP